MMRLNVCNVGFALGIALMVKGALIIVGAEIYFNLLEWVTSIFFGSVVVAAEQSIEDILQTTGILSFSVGAMYCSAALCNDVLFFRTGFLAFNICSIVLHFYLMNGGALSSIHLFVHVVESVAIVLVMLYVLTKEDLGVLVNKVSSGESYWASVKGLVSYAEEKKGGGKKAEEKND
jgi:hypothetical protein